MTAPEWKRLDEIIEGWNRKEITADAACHMIHEALDFRAPHPAPRESGTPSQLASLQSIIKHSDKLAAALEASEKRWAALKNAVGVLIAFDEKTMLKPESDKTWFDGRIAGYQNIEMKMAELERGRALTAEA